MVVADDHICGRHQNLMILVMINLLNICALLSGISHLHELAMFKDEFGARRSALVAVACITRVDNASFNVE